MDLEDLINEIILDYLTDELGYDFIHEVLAVYGLSPDNGETLDRTRIEYRGVHGEYGTLDLDVSPEDFFASFGE